MPETILVIVVVVVAALALLFIAAGAYFFRLVFVRSEKPMFWMKDIDPDLKAARQAEAEKLRLEMEGKPHETWEIQSEDGLRLRATYYPSAGAAERTAILVHGYKSGVKDMQTMARHFSEDLGFNVLTPALRGHGFSEGRVIGFGWLDRRDMLRWIAEVLKRSGDKAQIVLYGISMGAATVLMTSGETLPANVRAVVADCSYTSVNAELAHQLGFYFKLPAFAVLPMTGMICRLRGGYGFAEASAVRQVARSSTPTLFIHGEADAFVPYRMVFELHEACRSPKELFTVPGAGHGQAYQVDPDGYDRVMTSFLDRCLT